MAVVLLKGVNLDSSDLSRHHCTYMSWLGVENWILQYQMFRGEQRVSKLVTDSVVKSLPISNLQ